MSNTKFVNVKNNFTSEKLSFKENAVLSYLCSLSQKKYCYASNQHLCDTLGIEDRKDASASGFTINDALALPSTAWMFINPDGSPSYTTVFEAIKTDSDGDLIVENQPYTIFVVSFANTQQASISTMSFSQQDVTLISYVGLNEATLDQIAAIVQEGQIEIQLPEALLGTGLNADLVNLSGQVVGSKSLNNAQNFINTEELVNGMYFVHLKDGENSIKSIKVIIQ